MIDENLSKRSIKLEGAGILGSNGTALEDSLIDESAALKLLNLGTVS